MSLHESVSKSDSNDVFGCYLIIFDVKSTKTSETRQKNRDLEVKKCSNQPEKKKAPDFHGHGSWST